MKLLYVMLFVMHIPLLCMKELELLDEIEACNDSIEKCKKALSDLERNKWLKKNIEHKAAENLREKITKEMNEHSAEKEKLLDQLAK